MPDALGMGCSVDLVISLVCVVVSSKFILTSCLALGLAQPRQVAGVAQACGSPLNASLTRHI